MILEYVFFADSISTEEDGLLSSVSESRLALLHPVLLPVTNGKVRRI